MYVYFSIYYNHQPQPYWHRRLGPPDISGATRHSTCAAAWPTHITHRAAHRPRPLHTHICEDLSVAVASAARATDACAQHQPHNSPLSSSSAREVRPPINNKRTVLLSLQPAGTGGRAGTGVCMYYVCKDSAAPTHARTRAHRPAAPPGVGGIIYIYIYIYNYNLTQLQKHA